MTTRMTTTPAGWYPAPDGSPSEWYWDGAAQWTPNTGPRPVTGPVVGPHQPKKKKSRARLFFVTLFVLGVGGCGAVVFSSSSSTPTPDASLACDHYRNVMTDIGKGVLTPAEIRTKTKEISDNAAIAPAAVQTAATQMLAATTADNGDAFLKASSAMDSACSAAGR